MNINYLNKTYTDYQETLKQLLSVYYKDAIKNLSPTDPAKIYLDLLSYVGDVLSYYIDYQFKESLFLYAEDYKNIILLSQLFGYKPRIISPATVNLYVYQLVPSKQDETGNYVPDFDYGLYIKRGMKVSAPNSNIFFRTIDDINFQIQEPNNPTEVTVYEQDNNGNPTFFLLRKSVQAIAVDYLIFDYQIDEGKPYLTIEIPDSNVIGVEEVVDSEGNKWYEVDFLAQDSIFDSIENWDEQTKRYIPFILKYKTVTKRFITRYNENLKLELIFGSGSIENNQDEEFIPHSDNVGLMTPMERKIDYQKYNISNFLFTDSYGEIPHNTTLKIKYIKAFGEESNVLANTLTRIEEVDYLDVNSGTDITLLNFVKSSLAVNNPEAATGGLDQIPIDKIKENAIAYFTTQDRAVTENDYLLRTYSMPAKYGNIAKAYVTKNRNNEVEIFVLSYDENGYLTKSNPLIKRNLSVYLDRYRTLTDIILIKDAYIVNFQIYFSISVTTGYNSKEVLMNAIEKLKEYFDVDKWTINQPIIISEVQSKIMETEGVKYVQNIEFKCVFDEDLGYSPVYYDMENALKDGIIYPPKDPAIFEIRFPDRDIIGKVI